MAPQGRLRAWIETSDDNGVRVAFVGMTHGCESEPSRRPPAILSCASYHEARERMEQEARAVALPLEWIGDRS